MLGKNKKHAHNFNPLAKKSASHKKRNVLIGLAGAATAVVIAGATAKGQDQS